ncbi:hypothetical protein EBI00_12280 [Marinomonas hwangdonensis]|uniref:Uncharacterized protein n=1 Tax=Marinomonas hwangdonensis TaxID=1053647 RepID=A0A3M8Q0S0_9GAMM|nr:hypothetical protein EBI00_12280 [Marinomonas hwangdonensis]
MSNPYIENIKISFCAKETNYKLLCTKILTRFKKSFSSKTRFIAYKNNKLYLKQKKRLANTPSVLK